jgi:hypothetical protein
MTDTNSNVTNNLAQELNNLRIEYETNDSVRTSRNREAVIKATDHFLDTLVRSSEASKLFETNAREAASFGKKLVQLVTWSGRGPTYLNQTLSELLDFGDLCARFQDYFDATYGTDEFRVFHYPIRNTRTTALTVSWDKSGFDNADGIIRSNRERAQQRLESRGSEDQRPRRREYDTVPHREEAPQPQRQHHQHQHQQAPLRRSPRFETPVQVQVQNQNQNQNREEASPSTQSFRPRRRPVSAANHN